MQEYLRILKDVVENGVLTNNRTGVSAYRTTGNMFTHDMRDGFPLLTTKKMGMKTIAAELEFFIKGLSDKRWLQERGCHIWDEWCNPKKVKYAHDDDTKAKMEAESDLGRVYGVQWTKWNKFEYAGDTSAYGPVFVPQQINQLKNVIDTLKTNPLDRRMIVMAWNPSELDQMALPPCHYSFQILSDGEYIDLIWQQRSVDTPLGLPYNIASYALLLTLIAKTVNMKPRKLIGFLADVHIYENQMDGIKEQLTRTPMSLCRLELLDTFTDLFEWKYDEFKLIAYTSHPTIKFPIAV